MMTTLTINDDDDNNKIMTKLVINDDEDKNIDNDSDDMITR